MSQYDLVLDCSICMSWCFADESNNYSDDILVSLDKKTAIVPSVWALEVANVLIMAERKKRLTRTQSIAFKNMLSNLNIHIENNTAAKAFSSVMQLAQEHNLTAYDAAYLESAINHQLPIATLDKELKQAALSAAIACY